jgi:hypothetical protein
MFYATTRLTKVRIHIMPDPINPRFLRIHRVPKPETKDGEVLPPKPVPHKQAAINRTDLATELLTDSTWTSSGLPSQHKARPTRHHHIMERHKIIFVSVSLNAHGSSLLTCSAKLTTHVKRSTYPAEATDTFLRLHITARARPNDNPTYSSTSPHATNEDDNTDQPTDTHPGNNSPDDQPMHIKEDPGTTRARNPRPKNPNADTIQWQ